MLAAEKPHLKRLLFGAPAVQEIARRPLFCRRISPKPGGRRCFRLKTEIDLISEWWTRAGHDSLPDAAVMRQRALLDLAESGVRNLGKGISSRKPQGCDVFPNHIAQDGFAHSRARRWGVALLHS